MAGLDGFWIWSWQFDTDGDMEDQLAKCRQAGAGILIKVLDGNEWMSTFDKSPEAITDAGRAANVAQWFAERGVPVALWSVPKGLSDEGLDDEMARTAGVITQARDHIEAFVLDVEPYDHFWQGSEAQARQFVQGLRGKGVPIVVAPDARPWHLHGSMHAFCQEADGIVPQAYWRTFEGNETYYRDAGHDVGRITAAFMAEVTHTVFEPYGKDTYIIGQGDAPVAEWQDFLEAAAERFTGVTVWRQGVTPDDVRGFLGKVKALADHGTIRNVLTRAWQEGNWEFLHKQLHFIGVR